MILGVVTSEALYYSSNQFGSQISTIIPALIIPLLDVDVATLNHEYVAHWAFFPNQVSILPVSCFWAIRLQC